MSSSEKPSLGEWLHEEPFKMAFSSGFLAFWVHLGAAEALIEEDLMPIGLHGSSSGSFAATCLAADVEPRKAAEQLSKLRIQDCLARRPGFGLVGRHVEYKISEIFPVENFEECRITPQISTFDLLSREAEIITTGNIPRGLRASCAFPGLVQPPRIDGRPKLDGGIGDWSALSGLAPHERILSHRAASTMSKKLPIIGQDEAPAWLNLQTLELGDKIPKVPLLAPHQGMETYELAKAATLDALDQPIS